jgi:two-component system, OmpR family, phosphate regulon response regulator PhoB
VKWGNGISKKRILLIEDDPSLQVTLRYLLEDLGYEIVVASDHAEARAAIGVGRFDAAIVDYFLNNVPAVDLLAELRKHQPGTGILCSTAAFAEQIHLDDDALRPDAILYKPFSTEELRDALKGLIRD